MTTAKVDKQLLHCLTSAIEEFRKISPELQAQAMLTLLYVSKHQGISVMELAERLGTAHATASRNIALLSKKNHKGQTGPGLIEAKPSPADARYKVITTTAKGDRFLNRLLSLIDSGD